MHQELPQPGRIGCHTPPLPIPKAAFPVKRLLTAAACATALTISATACQPTALPSGTGGSTPTAGIWINAKEIAALPVSGAAWTSVRAAATKAWGTPTIADQNSDD